MILPILPTKFINRVFLTRKPIVFRGCFTHMMTSRSEHYDEPNCFAISRFVTETGDRRFALSSANSYRSKVACAPCLVKLLTHEWNYRSHINQVFASFVPRCWFIVPSFEKYPPFLCLLEQQVSSTSSNSVRKIALSFTVHETYPAFSAEQFKQKI